MPRVLAWAPACSGPARELGHAPGSEVDLIPQRSRFCPDSDSDSDSPRFPPRQISAMILTKMKETAEAFLGKVQPLFYLFFPPLLLSPRGTAPLVYVWGLRRVCSLAVLGERSLC